MTSFKFNSRITALQEGVNNESGNGRKQEILSEKKITNQNKLFDKRRVSFGIGNGIGIRTSPQSEHRNERLNTKEITIDDRVEQLQNREKALLEAVRMFR